jgi:hypothetical protein
VAIDPSPLVHRRQRIGQDGIELLLQAVQIRQHRAGFWRQSRATIAACMRTFVGVMGGAATPRQGATKGVPWLGLLLWAFACVGLFVSLIMRADDIDHDRRVAARSAATKEISDRSQPVRRLTRQASELSVVTARRAPSP